MVTGRKYVGKSKHIERRLLEHKRKAKVLVSKGDYFSAAIRKYGWDAFHWQVLEVVAAEMLAERELFWIDHLETFASNKGFNTRRDSSSGAEFSEDVRQKIAVALTGQEIHPAFAAWKKAHAFGKDNPFYGQTHTTATKVDLSEKLKARWADPEYRAKMSLRPTGRGQLGKKPSYETRVKQSLARKQYWENKKLDSTSVK